MSNSISYLTSWIVNLGTKSGMPKYTAILGLLQAGVLFVPESIWIWLGVNIQEILAASPAFLEYYIINSNFKNSMAVFWIISPFVLSFCTVLWIFHLNISEYQAFTIRREIILNKLGKTRDYSMSAFGFVFVIAYVWSTVLYLSEPTILGDFTPPKSRLAMLVFHAGIIGFALPVILAGMITDIRSNLFTRKPLKEK